MHTRSYTKTKLIKKEKGSRKKKQTANLSLNIDLSSEDDIIQNQNQGQNNNSRKKLTKAYKNILQKHISKIVYKQNQGLYLFGKLQNQNIKILSKDSFQEIYIKNFHKQHPSQSRDFSIQLILELLNSTIEFVARNHFQVKLHGSCSLQAHASWGYKLSRSRNSKQYPELDHRIRIPGLTGLLKLIFYKIFSESLKTQEIFKLILQDKSNPQDRKIEQIDQLFEIIQEHLQKITPSEYEKTDTASQKQQKYLLQLKQIDGSRQLDPNFIQWTLSSLSLKKDSYTVRSYQLQEKKTWSSKKLQIQIAQNYKRKRQNKLKRLRYQQSKEIKRMQSQMKQEEDFQSQLFFQQRQIKPIHHDPDQLERFNFESQPLFGVRTNSGAQQNSISSDSEPDSMEIE